MGDMGIGWFFRQKDSVATHTWHVKHLGVVPLLALMCSCSPDQHERTVADEAAAVALARNSWPRIYEKTGNVTFSDSLTKGFEPYSAKLEDGIWTVRGTIPADYRGEVVVTTVREGDGVVLVRAEKVK